MAILSLKDVSSHYGDIQAIRSVHLSVEAKEILAIVGSNGAGKTTLMNLISGILRCTSGEITFMKERIDFLDPHEIVSRGIAQIPEGRLLFPAMTVMENLEMGAYGSRARGQRHETLNRVFNLFPTLEERRTQIAGSLSGGEQQMLAIGRGLMANPVLLMLDEPSLGLAPIVVMEMFRIIREINEQGITILLVEQNIFHALSIAHKAYVLENGQVTMKGTAQEVLDNPDIRTAYLGI